MSSARGMDVCAWVAADSICEPARMRICTDLSIEAPPSLMPQQKYCDITGLEVRAACIVKISTEFATTGTVH